MLFVDKQKHAAIDAARLTLKPILAPAVFYRCISRQVSQASHVSGRLSMSEFYSSAERASVSNRVGLSCVMQRKLSVTVHAAYVLDCSSTVPG